MKKIKINDNNLENIQNISKEDNLIEQSYNENEIDFNSYKKIFDGETTTLDDKKSPKNSCENEKSHKSNKIENN